MNHNWSINGHMQTLVGSCREFRTLRDIWREFLRYLHWRCGADLPWHSSSWMLNQAHDCIERGIVEQFEAANDSLSEWFRQFESHGMSKLRTNVF
jgi:hypothetical protein